MMSDQYSMLPETVPDTSYSFTSRGPTPDGFFPTLCAPGGAIAPVPRHTLQGKAQYHGTSMASPNACGVAACVLSALHAQGVKPTPAELRRALENSAERPAEHEPFSQVQSSSWTFGPHPPHPTPVPPTHTSRRPTISQLTNNLHTPPASSPALAGGANSAPPIPRPRPLPALCLARRAALHLTHFPTNPPALPPRA